MNFKRIYYDVFRIKALQIELYVNGELKTKLYTPDTGQDSHTSKLYGSFTIPKTTVFRDGGFRIIRFESNSITPYQPIIESDSGIDSVYPGVNPLSSKLLQAMLQRKSLTKVLTESKTLRDDLVTILIIGGFFALIIVVIGVMFGGW